jgi:chaperonin GroES
MKLVPLGDHLIVKPLKKDEQTKSGIVIPDTNKEKPEQGEVIAVGPGKRNEKGERQTLEVKVGQTVCFRKYAPTEFKLDGETYLILSESDLLAIVE